MKKTLYTSYYSVLGALVIGLVIYTLFQTSLVVAYGHHQRQLRQQQQQLTEQQQQLQTQLAQKKSLIAFFEDSQLENYQLISDPIVIRAASSLAALQ